jgi:hypothetical protein
MRIMILLIAVLSVQCSNFLSKFENIQADKTRPLAIVFEPSEAAPGDTVHVRYYGYTPDSSAISISWEAVLDYAMDIYGGVSVESHKVNLDSMMLPGGTQDDFYFIVPDSVLLYSTYLKNIDLNIWNKYGWTIGYADSVLKFAVKNNILLNDDEKLLADMIGTKIELKASINAEIQVEVNRTLTVRYSRKFNSSNVNSNPVVRWIGLCTVDKKKLSSFDSVYSYPHSMQYLYYPEHPEFIKDTFVIDTGKTYFVLADSCIDGSDSLMQHYTYLSLINGSAVTARETYSWQWFYKDIDYNSSMKYDSLIEFEGSNSAGYAEKFLPPVDIAMHRFRFYLVMRDNRLDFEANGCSEYEVNGYFSYTPAYAAHPHAY